MKFKKGVLVVRSHMSPGEYGKAYNFLQVAHYGDRIRAYRNGYPGHWYYVPERLK